jgi:hypothetical protein
MTKLEIVMIVVYCDVHGSLLRRQSKLKKAGLQKIAQMVFLIGTVPNDINAGLTYKDNSCLIINHTFL